MTWKKRVLDYATEFPGSTDTEIEKYYRKDFSNRKSLHQIINGTARQLVIDGKLKRIPNPEKDGNIGNYPMV